MERKNVLENFLFFSKKEGKDLEKKILMRLDKMIVEQEIINQRINMLQEIIDVSNEKLMNYQTKESQNMYGILNQLLLKDVLENYDETLQELIRKHNSKS
ncbi:hypothetical protein HMPREF9015_01814 [Leptotrichia wadei F0279]|uniref:Uncharacterized protein n=1 Tax=Leptotrichia wadei (strain F0279) TaxID=888055 RepID=U2R4H4_LEPWF|nr:hypothetical protein HMPREF9015_01814 [Leptotrichia wadei F0279]